MNPMLNAEMIDVLETLDADDDAGVLVLTGAGDAFSAGMDLKEYFREVDGAPAPRPAQGPPRQRSTGRSGCCAPTPSRRSRWSTAGASAAPSSRSSAATSPSLRTRRPSASRRSTGGSRRAASSVARSPRRSGRRNALLYIMTGRTFDGRRAAEMGLVNWSTPRERLRGEVEALARELLAQEPGRAARRQGRFPQRPRSRLGRRRGLPLRQARAVAVPRRRGWPRGGAQAVPRREAHPPRPADLHPLMRKAGEQHRPAPAAWPGLLQAGLPAGLMQEMPLTLELILRRLESVGAQLAVTSALGGGVVVRHSWGEIANRSRRLISALAALGLQPGARVATLAWNSHRHLELFYAVPCSGRVLHTLNARVSPRAVGRPDRALRRRGAVRRRLAERAAGRPPRRASRR